MWSKGVVVSLGLLMGMTSSCDSPQGTDIIGGVPIVIPAGSNTTATGSHSTPDIGASCIGGKSGSLCLGLKYVVYGDASGNPIISRDLIASNVTAINMIWSQCNLGFQIDQLVIANPADYGLNLNPKNYPELDQARSAFANANLLSVITTGAWNRSGTLGNTGANAWTNMPGSNIMGVVLEQPVGAYPNIIAHELGHYLNLPHVSDTSDVMNPIIYSNSTRLNSTQCDSARAAATYWWSNMLRS